MSHKAEYVLSHFLDGLGSAEDVDVYETLRSELSSPYRVIHILRSLFGREAAPQDALATLFTVLLPEDAVDDCADVLGDEGLFESIVSGLYARYVKQESVVDLPLEDAIHRTLTAFDSSARKRGALQQRLESAENDLYTLQNTLAEYMSGLNFEISTLSSQLTQSMTAATSEAVPASPRGNGTPQPGSLCLSPAVDVTHKTLDRSTSDADAIASAVGDVVQYSQILSPSVDVRAKKDRIAELSGLVQRIESVLTSFEGTVTNREEYQASVQQKLVSDLKAQLAAQRKVSLDLEADVRFLTTSLAGYKKQLEEANDSLDALSAQGVQQEARGAAPADTEKLLQDVERLTKERSDQGLKLSRATFELNKLRVENASLKGMLGGSAVRPEARSPARARSTDGAAVYASLYQRESSAGKVTRKALLGGPARGASASARAGAAPGASTRLHAVSQVTEDDCDGDGDGAPTAASSLATFDMDAPSMNAETPKRLEDHSDALECNASRITLDANESLDDTLCSSGRVAQGDHGDHGDQGAQGYQGFSLPNTPITLRNAQTPPLTVGTPPLAGAPAPASASARKCASPASSRGGTPTFRGAFGGVPGSAPSSARSAGRPRSREPRLAYSARGMGTGTTTGAGTGGSASVSLYARRSAPAIRDSHTDIALSLSNAKAALVAADQREQHLREAIRALTDRMNVFARENERLRREVLTLQRETVSLREQGAAKDAECGVMASRHEKALAVISATRRRIMDAAADDPEFTVKPLGKTIVDLFGSYSAQLHAAFRKAYLHNERELTQLVGQYEARVAELQGMLSGEARLLASAGRGLGLTCRALYAEGDQASLGLGPQDAARFKREVDKTARQFSARLQAENDALRDELSGAFRKLQESESRCARLQKDFDGLQRRSDTSKRLMVDTLCRAGNISAAMPAGRKSPVAEASVTYLRPASHERPTRRQNGPPTDWDAIYGLKQLKREADALRAVSKDHARHASATDY